MGMSSLWSACSQSQSTGIKLKANMSHRKLLKESSARSWSPSPPPSNGSGGRGNAIDTGTYGLPSVMPLGHIVNKGNANKPYDDEQNHFDNANIYLFGIETLADSLIKTLEGVVEAKDKFKIAYNNANISRVQKEIIKKEYSKLKQIEKMIVSMAKTADNLTTNKIQ